MADASKPKRRAGIKPLCLIHQTEMSGPFDTVMEFYRCDDSDCEMCWRAVSEYFRFLKNVPAQPILFMQTRIPCSKIGHGHKFLARVSGNRGIWECSIEGCTESEERPLSPASLWDAPPGVSYAR
jgi:hypothetical protein